MKEIKDLKLKDNATLSKLTSAKLLEELQITEKNMFSLKMKLNLWEFKQTHLIKSLRRYVAKLNTLITNKEV